MNADFLAWLTYVVIAVTGYYFWRKYKHKDFRLLMWLGIVSIPVSMWDYYIKHILHPSSTIQVISGLAVHVFWLLAIILILRISFRLGIFGGEKSK